MLRIALLALATAAVMAPAAAHAQNAPVPVFDVGTAVVDITPTTPQYLGGYDRMDQGTAQHHDPLEVRAFFVGHGKDAVAFAIVDSQGWFAGYQEGPYGITEARQEAATTLTGMGYHVGPGNLIVSSTHSHAAPTIMGIWGPTDPAYLKRVHDATVQALVSAAQHTKRSQLWTADGDISELVAHNLEGTDHFDGWRIDPSTPILWARDPDTGATNGLYTNVPVHADQFDGAEANTASADHPGAERAMLDDLLGGTAVVAMGTLGRQEAMGGIHAYSEVERQSRYITNAILRALGDAKPLTDATIVGAEQYIAVPAHNPALLALLYGNVAGTNCDNPLDNCTIDRSIMPPYLAGNVVGTWVTALRIGEAVWVSEPGEAFPEVSEAIRTSIDGAREVHVVGMAQDQLGYYYPPEDYPASELNPSDFILFNVSPALADANVDAAATLGATLGFSGTPQHPMMANDDPQAFFRPGTQFWPSVVESSNPDREFLVGAKPSYAPVAPGQPEHTATPGRIDFGDGSPAVTISGDEQRVEHSFPGPGTYDVTTSTTDESGYTRTYTRKLIVNTSPTPDLVKIVPGPTVIHIAGIKGGTGKVLAAHWFCPSTGAVDGLRIEARAGEQCSVVMVASNGDRISTQVS